MVMPPGWSQLSRGDDDGLDRGWVVGRSGECRLNLVQRVVRGHEAVEVHPTGGDQCDGGRPCVRVAERADEFDLSVLDVRQRQRNLVAAHPDKDSTPGRSECSYG